MDGKSEAWRKAADELLSVLAVENKYLVSDMVIIFLESAGYGLKDYSPLGGAFKRAAKKGIISRIDRPTKQALWVSKVYMGRDEDTPRAKPTIYKGQTIGLRGFGSADGNYKVLDVDGNTMHLEVEDIYAGASSAADTADRE